MEASSFWEMFLHYGLFLGGIFQLICILAIVIVPSEKSTHDEDPLQEREAKNRKPSKVPSSQSTPITRSRERKKKR